MMKKGQWAGWLMLWLVAGSAAWAEVTFAVKPTQEQFYFGMPVTVALKITNDTDYVANVETGLNNYGNIQFSPQNPPSAFRLAAIPKESTFSKRMDTMVSPHDDEEYIYILDHWLSFRQPGTHTVNFKLVDSNGNVVNQQSFDITLVQPSAEQLAQVREKYQKLIDKKGDIIPHRYGMPVYLEGFMDSELSLVQGMSYIHNPALKDMIEQLRRKGYQEAQNALKNMP